MDLIHRKERIIFSTIDVINELGIQAVSTKRIAKYQEMSESTIFKHFENKTVLMEAVLEFYSQYDNDLKETIESKQLKGVAGISFFVKTLMVYYVGYPAITAITQGLDEIRYIPELKEIAERIIKNRYRIIRDLVKEAKIEGEMKEDVDEDVMANIIIGSNQSVIRKWRMEGFGFDLCEESNKILTTIFQAFRKNEK